MNDTIVALRTIAFRSWSFIPLVMVKKTGIVPSGLVNVKNEVKHNRAKGNKSSISIIFELANVPICQLVEERMIGTLVHNILSHYLLIPDQIG